MTNLPLANYGLNKIYKLFGIPIAYRVRSRVNEEIFLCSFGIQSKAILEGGIRLFSRKLPKKFTLASLENEESYNQSSSWLAKLPDDKLRVLYVLDELGITGGVERRLEMMFEWLYEHGVQPIIVAEKNLYQPLQKYPFFKLIQWAPNADEILKRIASDTKATTVEFNMKNPLFFHDSSVEELKKIARVGCMIHENLNVDPKKLSALDYRAAVSINTLPYENFIHTPNVVDFPDKSVTLDLNLKKALYIGRVERDKLQTIKNFTYICTKYGISYEIAGPIKQEPEVLSFVNSLPKDVFIGVINTRSFLEMYGDRYLFISGVGQVVLEATALNIPCLVATHREDAMSSTFVSKDNIENLLSWNCVLRRCPLTLIPSNVQTFFDVCFSGDKDKVKKFCTRRELEKFRNPDIIWSAYKRMLLGGT